MKQRAEDVKRWSGGRLGYVHLESMDDESFRTIYSDVLGKYNKCEGIVIDTRFNGGGRLHEDVEVLFSGEKYLTQVHRGRETCDMPSRRWNKPSIMVQCEANYSNAHGTPWVYKHMGLGKLVGAPVPGTMTSVSWETLQDPNWCLAPGDRLSHSRWQLFGKYAIGAGCLCAEHAGRDCQWRGRAIESGGGRIAARNRFRHSLTDKRIETNQSRQQFAGFDFFCRGGCFFLIACVFMCMVV